MNKCSKKDQIGLRFLSGKALSLLVYALNFSTSVIVIDNFLFLLFSTVTTEDVCAMPSNAGKLFYFGFLLLPGPMIKHPDDHVTFNGQFLGVSRPRP